MHILAMFCNFELSFCRLEVLFDRFVTIQIWIFFSLFQSLFVEDLIAMYILCFILIYIFYKILIFFLNFSSIFMFVRWLVCLSFSSVCILPEFCNFLTLPAYVLVRTYELRKTTPFLGKWHVELHCMLSLLKLNYFSLKVILIWRDCRSTT